ncbi:hypothetical protein Tco_0415903 [Tanacetum coccineum]
MNRATATNVEETFGLDICGDVQVAWDGGYSSNSKGAEFNVAFPRNCVVRLLPMAAITVFTLLVLVFLAVIQAMHRMRCEDTNQAARKNPELS